MSVHRTVLGPRYDALSAPVRALHDRGGQFAGRASIDGDTNALARLVRALAGLPPPGDRPLVFELRTETGVEHWTRHFGDDVMHSTVVARDGQLVERLGVSRLAFDLRAEAGEVRWQLASVRAFGVPLPLALFRGVAAREYVDGGGYAFEVEARLPLAGLVVRYRGTLDV